MTCLESPYHYPARSFIIRQHSETQLPVIILLEMKSKAKGGEEEKHNSG